MIELIVLLTVFTYGTNFVLYLILKNKKSMPIVEKASIVLGINMSVLLLDGIFAFVGKFIMLSEWELLATIFEIV